MGLFDIVERDKWRMMQEGFSRTLGICMQTVDPEGKSFPGVNSISQTHLDIINILPFEKGVRQLVDNVKKNKADNYYEFPAGLYLYAIPIEIRDEGTLGHILMGPALLQKKVSAGDGFADKAAGLKRFSFNGVESAVGLVHDVAHYIVQLNYDTKKLREKFSLNKQVDVLIKELYSSLYFQELMNTLLDVSINTAKANAGSIMLLDHDKNELSVRFSRGLKDDVARDARVKIGDGISGMVARNKKPLLLDAKITDPRIKSRLKRPGIKSSIVHPLEVRNRVFGVLNINNTKAHRFDAETMDLVSNLTLLTKTALNMFPNCVSSS